MNRIAHSQLPLSMDGDFDRLLGSNKVGKFFKSVADIVLSKLAKLERLIEAVFRKLEADDDRGLPLPEVLTILGIKKSLFYELQNPKHPNFDPQCPKPFKYGLTERSGSFWLKSKIMAFMRLRAGVEVAA
jgi:predicted DNA-binding transcriptional regulator AlpA